MSSLLKCPACKKNLYPLLWKEKVELDICAACHGIWFDLGEMVLVADSDSLSNIDQAFVGSYKEIDAEEITRQKNTPLRTCPKDESLLERHEYTGEAKLVLDYCSKCRGTWMDSGEFEGYVESQKDLWKNFPKATQEQLESVDGGKEEMSRAIYEWCIALDFGYFLTAIIPSLLNAEWAREKKNRKIYSEKYKARYKRRYDKDYKSS